MTLPIFVKVMILLALVDVDTNFVWGILWKMWWTSASQSHARCFFSRHFSLGDSSFLAVGADIAANTSQHSIWGMCSNLHLWRIWSVVLHSSSSVQFCVVYVIVTLTSTWMVNIFEECCHKIILWNEQGQNFTCWLHYFPLFIVNFILRLLWSLA